MTRPMRVLVVEDDEADAELVALALDRDAMVIDWRRVDTDHDLRAALADGPWDAVVSDYTLPGFGAEAALAVVRAHDADLPFVMASGTVGEDVAVGMMRQGANDYVLKGNLSRLGPALRREIAEAANRRARRAAERLSHDVLDSLESHVAVLNGDGVIIQVNAAWQRFAEASGSSSPAALGVGTNYLEVCRRATVDDAADSATAATGIERVLRGERVSFSFEYALPTSAVTRWFVMHVSPLAPAGAGAVVAHTDITVRKRAELLDRRLASIVESSEDAIISTDVAGMITSWNPAAESLYGWSAAEAIGRPATILVPPTLLENHEALMARARAGERGAPAETLRLHRDGLAMSVTVVTAPLYDAAGALMGITKIVRDVRNLRRAEDALLASEQRLRAFFSADLVGVFTWVRGGDVSEANPTLLRLLGFTREELLAGQIGLRELTPAEWRSADERAAEQLAATGRCETYEKEFTRRDGTRVRVLVGGALVDSVSGVAFVLDITAQRAAERERARTERRFKAAIEKSFDAVVLQDATGTILYASPACERIGGRPSAEFVGRNMRDWMHPDDLPELERMWTELFANPGGVMRGVSRFRRADGAWGSSEWSVTNLLDDPDLGAIVVNLRDVTERVAAEAERELMLEELHHTSQLLHAVADNSPDAIYVKDADLRYQLFSPAAARFVGREVRDVIGRDDVDVFGIEAGSLMRERDRRVLTSGESMLFEEEVEAAGTRVVFQSIKTPYRDALGTTIGLIGISRDITERKRAEQALAESEARYRTLLDRMPDPVFVYDFETLRILAVNDAATANYGYSREELLAKTALDIRPAEDGPQFLDRLAQVAKGHQARGIWRHVRKDGTLLDVEVSMHGVDLGGRRAGIAVARDVSERKRAQDALLERDARLAEALHIARMGYWHRDTVTGRLEWSDELFQIFGVSRAGFPLTFDAFLALIVSDDRAPVQARIADAVAAGTPFDHRYRILVGGEERVIHEVGVAIKDARGATARLSGTARDVTKAHRDEEALRLRDRAIGAAMEGIVISDPTLPDNPVVFVSPSVERMTGYPPAELLGRNCRVLQGRATDAASVARVRKALRSGVAVTVELLNYRKDGTTFWNELSISPIHDEAGRLTHFVGVQSDVTERRRLEEQFRQAQKMEAVGQLAGGVAHDFNNLLTIITGYADLLLGRLPDHDPSRELIAEIHRAGERSAGLTRQLLAFSRRQVIEPRDLDLNTVVLDAERMLRRLIGEDVHMRVALHPQPCHVRADAGQIEQILINLAVNARDAMPTGGDLTIETSELDVTAERATTIAGAVQGRYVQLRVADTGSGMTPEVRARLFEPFFTTKEAGRGTGLGLAVVYGIVQQSGGVVLVESEPGRGSSFSVLLPRLMSRPRATTPLAATEAVRGGTERILLVEDEDALRGLCRRVLVGSGYGVADAPNGERALELVAAPDSRIDLLISDVVMPDGGGRQLAEQLRERWPGLKVLFISGYTNDAVLRHGVAQDRWSFLAKPFSPSALVRKVREVLDAPVHGATAHD